MSAWHIIITALTAMGILVWIFWAARNVNRWRYAVAPLTYLIHVVVFYVAVYTGNLSPLFLNGWSSAVRVHSLILVITTGFILLYLGSGAWKRQSHK